MVEQGFVQSKNDPCLYHRPTDTVVSADGMGDVNTGIQVERVDLHQSTGKLSFRLIALIRFKI